ncbi:MAG: hypothetical protein HXX15_03030 [Rhodopseudomonas sp.]|uniref:hypothetical protein n=1 Tax=Rhodopseudomonas sp. TaxID=1078 RepID=UPI00182C7EB8|nr:hypothetical protein [Rhodopseudomonas sp.]NVN85040.1 hypothetical protein [Rhodopseudomonas sp.]
MAHDARSMEEIKRDTERARAELTQTVDQLRTTVGQTADDLRERISPSAIKAEMSDYFKTRGEALVDRVTHAARTNPVQAVAVGATLAYPLFRLLRAIPAPVLMVGAGLYLAGSKSGQQVTQKASDAAVDFAGEVERRARDFGADATDTATAAAQYASGTLHAAGDAASSRAAQFRQAAASTAAEWKDKADEFGKTVTDTVNSGVDDLRRRATAAGEAFATEAHDIADKGAGLTDAVAGSIRDTAASARDSATDAAARLRSSIGEAAAASRESAAKVRERAADLGDQAGKTLVETVGNHPLLVAGVGLVLGGLLASAIPHFRHHREPAGSAGNDPINRAKAAEGASRTAQDAESGELGVTGNVTDIGPRARKVAEAAASSFETPSQNKH